MFNSSGWILSYIWTEKQLFPPHVHYVKKHFHILTLTRWIQQDEVILSILMKRSSLFPGLYMTTFCPLSLQNTWICFWGMNGRWLTTEVWIPMVLNSTFSLLLLQPKYFFFFIFYCIKVDQIKAVLELQSFIALHFPFCSLIFHRWFPASVSLKRCLSWQTCSAVF